MEKSFNKGLWAAQNSYRLKRKAELNHCDGERQWNDNCDLKIKVKRISHSKSIQVEKKKKKVRTYIDVNPYWTSEILAHTVQDDELKASAIL